MEQTSENIDQIQDEIEQPANDNNTQITSESTIINDIPEEEDKPEELSHNSASNNHSPREEQTDINFQQISNEQDSEIIDLTSSVGQEDTVDNGTVPEESSGVSTQDGQEVGNPTEQSQPQEIGSFVDQQEKDPQFDSFVESEIPSDLQLPNDIQVQANEQIESQTEPNILPEIESQSQPNILPEIESQNQPEILPAIQSNLQQTLQTEMLQQPDQSQNSQNYMQSQQQYQVQPTENRSKNSKIFIGALSPETDENDLRKLFCSCGEIREVKVIRGQNGESKCYGFVYFTTDESAQFAQERYQGMVLNGRACDIKIGNSEVCLYITGIKRDWSSEQCESKIKSILPNVTRISFPEDTRQPGTNRGFVYVYFSSRSVAQKVLIALQRGDYIVDGVLLNGNWPDTPTDSSDLDSINKLAVHISSLPPGVQENEIRQIFAKYGDIEKVTMSRDITNGQKDDYAFVNYKYPGPAEKAIEANYDLEIRGIKVEVNYNKRNDAKNKQRKNNNISMIQPTPMLTNPGYQQNPYSQYYMMNYQAANQNYSNQLMLQSQMQTQMHRQDDDNVPRPANYKTQLCRHYKNTYTCPKGASCQYAHGEMELRPISRGHGGPSHSALGSPVLSPYLSAAYNLPSTNYVSPVSYAQYYAASNMYQYSSNVPTSTQSAYTSYQYPYGYYSPTSSYSMDTNTYYSTMYGQSNDTQTEQ